MKNNGLFFTRNDCRQAAARENMKLKAEIHQTQHKMESLLNQFDQVTDPPLIDCCIYELNAVWLRYQFLAGGDAGLHGHPSGTAGFLAKRNYAIRRT